MPSPPAPPPFEWIDSSASLRRAAQGWRRQPRLAIDTEFVRERTFFPQLGLVQLADADGIYLVDPLAIDDLTPLAEALADPTVLKVAHSPSEDLEVLYHAFGSFPLPLFDTQVAAAVSGLEASMGYRRLVAEMFDVELAKEHTRTNWLRRPLSEEQLTYAARDVVYLLEIHERLGAQFQDRERLGWVLEEARRLADPVRFLPPPEDVYLRVGGLGRLNRRQLAALQILATWRERRARQRDLPRNFVLREGTMLALAKALPETPDQLAAASDLTPRQQDRLGPRLLSLVAEARSARPGQLPPRPAQLGRDDRTVTTLNALQKIVQRRAEELQLPATVLASRRDLKNLVLAIREERPEPPPPFDGWRWQQLQQDFLPVLEAFAT